MCDDTGLVPTDAIRAAAKDSPRAAAKDSPRAAVEDSPTTELVTGVVGDRCSNCQAPVAPDQRYCVSCGDRRGRPRFSYDALVAQAAPTAATETPVPPRRGSRFSSGTNLIAGVATLLIAIGVGVLIGHYSASSPSPRASAPQVITVGGGSGAGAGTAAAPTGAGAASTASTAGPKGKAAKVGKVKVTHVVVTQKVKAAATAAASKVLGSSNNLSHNATQQVGSSCTGGAGCEGGKFTGNFFPGG